MTHMLSLLPVLACAAMMLVMFGGAAVLWLAARTPLGRLSWFERRARRAHGKAHSVSEGSPPS
jgi:hypothetical protein